MIKRIEKANSNKPKPNDITKELSEEETKLLNRCRLEIQRGFVQIGRALMTIRDKRLYRATHASFESFCQEEFQMIRSRAYYYIDAVKVIDNLSTNGEHKELPSSERVARELGKVKDPEDQKKVWSEAVKATPKGRKTTAQIVRNSASKMAGKKVTPKGKAPSKKVMEEEYKKYKEMERKGKDPRHELLKVVARVSGALPKLFTEGKFAIDLDILIKCREWVIPSVLKGIAGEFEEVMLEQKAKLLGQGDRPTRQKTEKVRDI